MSGIHNAGSQEAMICEHDIRAKTEEKKERRWQGVGISLFPFFR